MLSTQDLAAITLSLKLATVVTVVLLLLAVPLAWWLATSRSRFKPLVNTLVALPLVLPPTVIGFYLLLALGPNGPLGQLSQSLGLGSLAFSFWGLVLASLVYSLPFAVQPLQTAFAGLGLQPLALAATLGASPLDRFCTVVLPLARPGVITAAVLTFAHTIGEFGIVLMIGGNIPGETQLVSLLLYDHVEALDYAAANRLALTLVGFALVTLLLLYAGPGRRLTGRWW